MKFIVNEIPTLEVECPFWDSICKVSRGPCLHFEKSYQERLDADSCEGLITLEAYIKSNCGAKMEEYNV